MSAHRPAARLLQLQLACALVVFLVAATLPYLWLIAHFGYDDILREPAATILAAVQRGGAPLAAAWFCFAMSSLLFIPVALALQRLVAGPSADKGQGSAVAALGMASAVAQAIGLLRWVLVVPALAASFADPAATAASSDAVLLVFDAVHRFGGMVVGEMVGQLLLAGWTGGAAWQLWRSRAVPRWLAAAGLLSPPLWLLGQSELLHPVLPQVPQIQAIPLAFMAWEAWLASLAGALFFSALRGRRRQPRMEVSSMPS